MVDDTGIGAGPAGFPRTRGSAILAMRSADAAERRQAFGALVEAYWQPVFRHLRLKWHRGHEDAKDLTQAFFERALEKDWFQPFDPARARFRTFLRTCLDGFVQNEAKAAARLKRGGGERIVALDFENAEQDLLRLEPLSPESVERCFDDAWVRGLFQSAVAQLRRECTAEGREVHFLLLERYDLERGPGERVTYETLARDTGLTITEVTNRLAFVRRELRRIVLDRLRAITASDAEFREEARLVLGLDPP